MALPPCAGCGRSARDKCHSSLYGDPEWHLYQRADGAARPAAELIIRRKGGTVEGIYSDAVPYRALAAALGGTLKTARASNVEPTEDGRWTADMALRGGPELGPFDTHGEAIEAETEWIRVHILGIAS